jgi:hypothetical protein
MIRIHQICRLERCAWNNQQPTPFCYHVTEDVVFSKTQNRYFNTLLQQVEAELEKKLSIDHIPTSLWTSRLATALTHMLHYQVIPAQIYTPMAFPTRPDLSQSERTTQIRVPSQSERCKKPTLR